MILAREQLLGDPGLSPLDRTIDVRISRLRRKLEADAQNPRLIKTVYGAGYLFAATVTWESGALEARSACATGTTPRRAAGSRTRVGAFKQGAASAGPSMMTTCVARSPMLA